MASLSDIMSQQLVEELHVEEFESQQPVSSSPSDQHLTEDELLARELQRAIDAEELENPSQPGPSSEKSEQVEEGEASGMELTEDERLAREMQRAFDAEEVENPSQPGSSSEKSEQVEGGEAPGMELTEDERLAREMQQSYDAELAASLSEGTNVGSFPEEGGEGYDEKIDTIADFDCMGTPLYQSNRDAAGEVITKHNPVVCGMRNANRIGLYIDGAGDMDGTIVANSAYNDLKKKSQQSEKKGKSSKKTVQ